MDETSDARTHPNRLPAILLIAGLAAVTIAGAVVALRLFDSDSDASVTLVPVSHEGVDPFTDSVQVDEVQSIEPAAANAVANVQDSLPRDDTTSGLVATGTTPGLYGGSGEDDVCDAVAMIAFLGKHPEKAAAWSDVLGITPERIEEYITGLTPVVLMTDTLVTNHGFRDGKATESTSVLQVGTAVMVDNRGVPRVKCNCGNPLTEPEPVDLADAELTGNRWDDFDPDDVARVRAGDPVDELTLCNLRTGELYSRPVGSDASGGSPPPNLDGTWTVTLTRGLTDTESLPPGTLDPNACPNATLDGATMIIRGRRVSVEGAGEVADLGGTLQGAPAGSPEWLAKVQRGTKGAVIHLDGDGAAGDIELTVATGRDSMHGAVDTVDARGIGTGRCAAGVRVQRAGTGSATTAPATTTTEATTTIPNVASLPAGLLCKDLATRGFGYPEAVDYWRQHGQPENMDADDNGIPCETVYPATDVAAIWGNSPRDDPSPSSSGGPCDQSSLLAVFIALGGGDYKDVSVTHCDGKWALLTVIRPDLTEDYPLLEWTGSAWQGGACERYRDPNDWTKSAVVPSEFWIACVSD